ncbi:MAG: iron-containing alcohol dehydrogenase [Desulfobacterales bacterium]|nr:iron-containing alcohol dehydrogenase [Desulfobacterales bacterium]
MEDFFKMTDIFMFQLPRKIIFGNGAAAKIGNEARGAFVGEKAFLVTDKGVAKAGLVKGVMGSLEAEGFKVQVFDQVVPDSPISVVMRGVELARQGGADLVVGLGGGSSIDTAKAISFMIPYQGDIRENLGINQVKKPGLPKIFIPTTAGTGSELSHTFVLYDDESGDKITSYSPHTFADMAIIDPSLTLSLPPRVTAESGIDAFSHALESFVTIRANPLSDLFSLRGVELVSKNLRKAFAKGSHNLDARYAMCFGVCMGTMAIRSSGIGAVHATCYPAAMKYNLSHGVAIGLMMPSVMAFNLISNLDKYAAVSRIMGERVEGLTTLEAAQASVEAVKRLIVDVGLPTRLSEVGARQKDFPDFARTVMTRYAHHVRALSF